MNRSALLLLCLFASARAEVATSLDPLQKIPEGKTVVWSPLFQATWDAMNDKMGGKPKKTEPPNDLMTRLDDFEWNPEKVMPEGRWKTWAGEASEEFLKTVNAEAAELTGEPEGPFALGDFTPGTVACFGLMDREVAFKKPFYRSEKVPLKFGPEKTPVRFFGTIGEMAGSYGETVKVLSYRPASGSHALEISCKDGDDKVLFYMPPGKQDFATACKWLREWRKTHAPKAELSGRRNDRLLHEGDEVRVPYITLDAEEDLTSQLQGSRFYGNAGDPWTISRAEQVTKFELFEKGARVRIEASIELDPFGPAARRTVPRRFVYDRPFFVFLWRDDAEWPYLGVWVGDDSALQKF